MNMLVEMKESVGYLPIDDRVFFRVDQARVMSDERRDCANLVLVVNVYTDCPVVWVGSLSREKT